MVKNKRANSFDTGVAAEYFILSQLYRLGVEAYISQGNKKAIDIRIVKKDGTTVSLDVKAVRSYSSLVVNNVTNKKDHFIVFVIYNNKFENLDVPPEIFIVPSDEIDKLVSHYKKEKRVLKGNLEKGNYKDRWDLLI